MIKKEKTKVILENRCDRFYPRFESTLRELYLLLPAIIHFLHYKLILCHYAITNDFMIIYTIQYHTWSKDRYHNFSTH